MNSLPSLPPVSPFDPSPVVIGLLCGVFLLCLGLLAGYQMGKLHRRTLYRKNLQELQETARAWRNAYDEAVVKIKNAAIPRPYVNSRTHRS